MRKAPREQALQLNDGLDSFQALVLEPGQSVCTILFSSGRGGNPRKHYALLKALAEHGCQVIAPHLDMLASTVPAEEELVARLRRLEIAVQSVAQDHLPVVGIGHSIGATLLLVLAGARASTLAGEHVASKAKIAFSKLLLFAPATDFFRRPNALDRVHTPVVAWAGTHDMITPPQQAGLLGDLLGSRSRIEVRLVEGAGHFTFMNELPPHVSDPYPDRAAFLAKLADEVCELATG